MHIYDCHVEFGPRPIPPVCQAPDAAAVCDLLATLGITRALAVHCSQYELHPRLGNARIVEETRAYPQLCPTWALLPPQTDELGTPEAFILEMRRAGVPALWAYPRAARFDLTGKTLGSLLEEMARFSVPLFLNISAQHKTGITWEMLSSFLDDAPRALPVVAIVHDPWGADRYFRALLDAHAQLSLGLSGYLPAEGLLALYQRYGAGRFLYGSSYPDHQPGGSLLMLLHAGLPDEALAAIAGGNLDRLLAEVPW